VTQFTSQLLGHCIITEKQSSICDTFNRDISGDVLKLVDRKMISSDRFKLAFLVNIKVRDQENELQPGWTLKMNRPHLPLIIANYSCFFLF